MPATKEDALALIPKASLKVLRAQMAHSLKRVSNWRNDDRAFHQWLLPLLEAELKRRALKEKKE